MALIGTLRNKAGTWAAVFVFVAIAAFTLGDIFSGNSNILNWGRNSVGEIGGKEISYEEFQNVLAEREQVFTLNNGREPGDREQIGLRQQAWDLLIARHAIQPEFRKVGVSVTEDELVDMINGTNISPTIQQYFTNPQTGVFDRAQLNTFLQYIQKPENVGSMQRVQWDAIQRDLPLGRERLKYENLLLKSAYVTKAEAERQYHNQTDVVEAKYLFIPYVTISDSAAQVTDADLKDYYDRNKEKFKTEATRDIKYVAVPLTPSAEDTAAIKTEMIRIAQELKVSTEDSLYAAQNSDAQNSFQKYNPGTLPSFVNKDSLSEGKVFGPFLDGDGFKVVKISRAFNDTLYSARASHILFRWTDESDAAKKIAKENALKVLKEIKGGASFADMARIHGTDGTAQQGGDLGWFSNNGGMVKPFEDAIFSATKTGVLNDVVETQFGYHLIDITNAKTNKAFEVAVVERNIIPSDKTTTEAFSKAESLVVGVSDIESFEAKAKEQNLAVQEAKNIQSGARSINMLGEARPLVMWLFREAETGKVSQVFEMEGMNVVAVMTGETEKGYKSVDQVKNEITPEVQKIVKGRIIKEKLKGITGTTLEEIAKGFGTDANVYTASDLRLSSSSLPYGSTGVDPVPVGAAFSVENGKRTAPVEGENGIVIIEVQNKTIAPAQGDYSAFTEQLKQGIENRDRSNIAPALRDNADIEDKRYKFF
jgi:peptidyl-prolyl cis-trans isomerase D